MFPFLSRLSPTNKASLKNFGRNFGLEIRISGANSRDDLRLMHFLNKFGIDLVLDVGANKGQFASELYAVGYSGRIISFEALPGAHKELSKAAAESRHDWRVAPQMALSSEEGEADFFITNANTSSSLLEPSPEFASQLVGAQIQEKISVPTVPLDTALKNMSVSPAHALLKIDVQGAEQMVLAGSAETLDSVAGVLVELSFANMYENQGNPLEIVDQLTRQDFEVWDIIPGYRGVDYRLNQIDLICFKTGLTERPF